LPTSSWENLEPPSNPSSGHFFDMFPSERWELCILSSFPPLPPFLITLHVTA
jgi:hypothetical protein